MSVAKVIEITSQSPDGFAAAIEQGLKKAAESVRNIKHAWVQDHEVHVTDDAIVQWKVSLKVTFVLD